MKKRLVLCLIVFLSASSLILAESVFAQSIPKPSVPEFTVSLADNSYDVAPVTTFTTSPYNNKTITTTIPGYHVKNITIDLTIVNQPCPAIINGNASFVYYNVRIKGHFGQDWRELFRYYGNSPVQSNSQYTVISLPIANYRGDSDYGVGFLEVGDQIDIQVQAAIGYKIITYIGHPPMPNVYTESVDFHHASSDWSPTSTFKVPDISPVPTPDQTTESTPNQPSSQNPTATQTQQGSENIILLGLSWSEITIIVLLGIIAVFVVVVIKKHNEQLNPKTNQLSVSIHS